MSRGRATPYVVVTGCIFAILAGAHLWRLFDYWPITFGSWLVPRYVSIFGFLLAGGLAVWAFRLARRAP